MSTTPPDYGEPWKVEKESTIWISTTTPEDGGDIACVEPDYGASTAYWPQRAGRIVACVNACAGIPDPEAAIQAAREALEAEEDWRNQRDDTGTLRAIARHKREKALNLLSQKP